MPFVDTTLQCGNILREINENFDYEPAFNNLISNGLIKHDENMKEFINSCVKGEEVFWKSKNKNETSWASIFDVEIIEEEVWEAIDLLVDFY